MVSSTLFTLTGLLAIASAMPKGFAPPSDIKSRALPMPDISKIKSVDPSSFPSFPKGGLVRGNVTKPDNSTGASVTKRWSCSGSAIFTWGDQDNGGKGITITNADTDWRGFYIYHNSCDSVPYKYIWINAGETNFVSLPDGFEGRITRGTDAWNLKGVPQTLATWFEFSFDSRGVAWGDVSLIRGCDGGVLMWSLDGSGAWKGFTQWILDGAPYGSYDMKSSGIWVLKATEGDNAVVNTIPRDWEMQQVGEQYVYVDDYHGNPVISSNNGRFGTYWPGGRA